MNRVLIAQQRVKIFKPKVDTRHKHEMVVSHNDNSISSTTVKFARDIPLLSKECEVIGIDEVQFFDMEIIEICKELANSGKRVIVAGLDMDFRGNPFGPMPLLMAIAEYVTKVHAICVKCGKIASYSYRLNPIEDQVVVGEMDVYEARCRKCFFEGEESSHG